MYTAALAITSQGETVDSNVRLADIAYKHFRKTGTFPTNLKGKKKSLVANLKKVNAMVAERGIRRCASSLARNTRCAN